METHLILSSHKAKRQANNYDQRGGDFTIYLDSPLMLDTNKRYQIALDEIIECSYSWYNISKSFGNNQIKYRKTIGSDTAFKMITFPDGSYSYNDIDTYIKSVIPKDNDNDPISIRFSLSLFRAEISIRNNYELNISSDFNEILGYDKGVLSSGNHIGVRVPNITRSVDTICIHCSLVTRAVTDERSDVIYCFNIVARGINRSYPFSIEPRRLKWNPVNKTRIDSIRMYVTDSLNRPIHFNGVDTAYHIIIKEVV